MNDLLVIILGNFEKMWEQAFLSVDTSLAQSFVSCIVISSSQTSIS
ncbi:hypothetical protein SLEP1_g52617 [Rubroshorea leprosula]|uniref:Uncharacterized protein n=1 Tax=Rubroshorea leprosula TaxID=152421 RepID=A0AAV5M6U3_9ROSI|nr:hypothetical protein SLEP1_g52617 [Rubroshorea leprosula]